MYFMGSFCMLSSSLVVKYLCLFLVCSVYIGMTCVLLAEMNQYQFSDYIEKEALRIYFLEGEAAIYTGEKKFKTTDGVYSAEYRAQLEKDGAALHNKQLGTPTPFLQIQQQQQQSTSPSPQKSPLKIQYPPEQSSPTPPPVLQLQSDDSKQQLYTPPASPPTVQIQGSPPAVYTKSSPSAYTQGSPPAVPPHQVDLHGGSQALNKEPLNSLPNGSHTVYYADEITSPSGGFNTPSTPGLALSPQHENTDASFTGSRTPSGGSRRRQPSERAYFIVKELLTTERTYNKDLEVINGHFRTCWESQLPQQETQETGSDSSLDCPAVTLLLRLVAPILDSHAAFLSALENRLANWDGRGNTNNAGGQCTQHVVDLIDQLFTEALPMYETYLQQHQGILEGIVNTIKKSRAFETFYRGFESEKVCYLPFTALILKPLFRLYHYLNILEFLCNHYSAVGHPEFRDAVQARTQVSQAVINGQQRLLAAVQFVKLVEIELDLIGLDNLVQPGRTFIREGCLQKLSRKGYQQRMFFLFNDVLLYTNRTSSPRLQFKVHGQLPLRGVMVEEAESRMGAANCFTIYGGNRALMVAANNAHEKQRWLQDLNSAISLSKTRPDQAMAYLSLKSASDEVLDHSNVAVGDGDSASELSRRTPQQQQPSNSSVHVCWHRATSVHCSDYIRASQNQLSGYLLRKFKNSMGWQKLWVVFTNFCLFFYKTFTDDAPLASLPLLGYTVSTPAPHDMINKEYVFKLQFKNHVYFFRAESEYTFSRWLDVIGMATEGSALYNGASPPPPLPAAASSAAPLQQTVQI